MLAPYRADAQQRVSLQYNISGIGPPDAHLAQIIDSLAASERQGVIVSSPGISAQVTQTIKQTGYCPVKEMSGYSFFVKDLRGCSNGS